MIDWIMGNYAWFFSGLGVFMVSTVAGLLIRRGKRNARIVKETNVIANKSQVTIVQSASAAHIGFDGQSYEYIDQVLREPLQTREPARVQSRTEPTRQEEICDPEKERAKEYNEEGVKLGREGKYHEAVKRIREAMSLDPGGDLYKRNLVAITETYASSLVKNSRQFDKAIDLLEELKQEGLLHSGFGYWVLGYAYFNSRLYEQAISAYQQAICFEPEGHLHYLYLAEARTAKGVKDKDLDCQEGALKEVGSSLVLNPQQIQSHARYPSFAELILLDALFRINQGMVTKGGRDLIEQMVEQIEADYKDFLLRVGCYAREQVDKFMERWSWTFYCYSTYSYVRTVQEKEGRVDLDTMFHGTKSVEELQAMIKESTNTEIPIPALLKFLPMLSEDVNRDEKLELAGDLVRRFGEKKTVVFARALAQVLDTRRRWIITYLGWEQGEGAVK
jgi:tetratricopeptide (TPR) repeat protein